MELLTSRRAIIGAGLICPYIRDGLVFWLDGKNRGGVSGTWRDLINGYVCTLSGDYVEGDKGVYFPDNGGSGRGELSNAPLVDKNSGTVELVVKLIKNDTAGRPVLSIAHEYMGASIAPKASSYGPCLRWYLTGSSMYYWRAPNVMGLTLTASGNKTRGIINGVSCSKTNVTSWALVGDTPLVASRGGGNPFYGTIYGIRLYDRILSETEIKHNQQVDNTRYNLGITIN